MRIAHSVFKSSIFVVFLIFVAIYSKILLNVYCLCGKNRQWIAFRNCIKLISQILVQSKWIRVKSIDRNNYFKMLNSHSSIAIVATVKFINEFLFCKRCCLVNSTIFAMHHNAIEIIYIRSIWTNNLIKSTQMAKVINSSSFWFCLCVDLHSFYLFILSLFWFRTRIQFQIPRQVHSLSEQQSNWINISEIVNVFEENI